MPPDGQSRSLPHATNGLVEVLSCKPLPRLPLPPAEREPVAPAHGRARRAASPQICRSCTVGKPVSDDGGITRSRLKARPSIARNRDATRRRDVRVSAKVQNTVYTARRMLPYLLKSDAVLHVTGAIEAVSEHKPYFTASVSKLLLRTYVAQAAARPETVSSLSQLTEREREMVQLLSEGHSTKGASVLLGIRPKTAETHRTRLMSKLGFHSVAELVRFAIRHRMIEP
jgi:DNA-binding CsgD family transcriptional regulator